MQDLADLFAQGGGHFVTPSALMAEKAQHIKAFLFDWDGVFNNGAKGEGTTSLFAEPDAAGTNYLRFGYWLRQRQMPTTAIITGEHNLSAFQLARREHFDMVCFRFNDKIAALDMLCERHGLQSTEIAFVFDDVLDLAVAARCGLRFLVRRRASPLMARYVQAQGLCDYVSGSGGHEHAVREICELFLGLTGNFDEVMHHRIGYSPLYQAFLSQKKSVSTQLFTQINGEISPIE